MQAYTSLLVLTDLEPDDLVALHIVLAHPTLPALTAIIVGEGVRGKCDVARALVEHCATHKNVRIAQGAHSDKEYPEALADAVLGVGYGTEDTGEDAAQLIRETLATEHPLIIALKPAYELYDAGALSHATLAMYGSFNFRTTFKTHEPATVAQWLTTSFKRVYLYESFLATGAQSSANATNAPQLFDAARMCPMLTAAMRAWNEYIVLDCTESIASSLTKAATGENVERALNRIERNNKIIGAILRGGVDSQLVLADMGLVAALLDPESIKWTPLTAIRFNDAHYTQVVAAPLTTRDARLFAVLNVPFVRVTATVAALLADVVEALSCNDHE